MEEVSTSSFGSDPLLARICPRIRIRNWPPARPKNCARCSANDCIPQSAPVSRSLFSMFLQRGPITNRGGRGKEAGALRATVRHLPIWHVADDALVAPKVAVESGCGAVAVGRACLLPPLSSGGALVARP